MKQVALGVLMVFGVLSGASAGQAGATKISGHLVDAVCAGNHSQEAGYGEKHENSCNLMDGCAKTGYTVLTTDKKVVKLDKHGNELAAALVKSTKKERDLQVTATGTTQDGVLAVKTLTVN
jgi:hypothetical protein